MRILYADDQDDLRLLTKQYLQKAGHQVRACASGQEALRAWAENLFDVLLLDEQMPGMSGAEVLLAIRKAQTSAAPIVAIALTGFDTDFDKERLRHAGFDVVLGKPCRFELLESTIRAVASKKFPNSQGASASVAPNPAATAALARVGGDAKLLAQMARTFLRDLPPRVAELEDAIRRKDAEALASRAHALKGSLLMFAADRAATLCKELQQLAKRGDFSASRVAFTALKEAIADLQPNLRGYAGQKRTSGPAAPSQSKTKSRSPDSKRRKP